MGIISKNKPIDAEYLLNQLKNLDKSILEAKYVQEKDIKDTYTATDENPISGKGVSVAVNALQQDINGKSEKGHKHTKSEITDFPTSMTPTAHNQASNTINAMTDYAKATSASAITTTDTLNIAIGKLEKALDGKANSSHTHTELMSKNNPTGTGSFSLNRKANTTIGDNSFAEGNNTTASGAFSHAEGDGTTASGNNSHAEGKSTSASASYTHSEGVNTSAVGQGSHAEGSNLELSGSSVIFEDPREVIIEDLAIGDITTITVVGSQAFGLNSHAEGCSTLAYGKNSHTEGYHTFAQANESHAEGCESTASGAFAHAEGYFTEAIGESSHAEGCDTTAGGRYSHAEGRNAQATSYHSHAEGYQTTASQNSSHAEGYYTKATNYASHASGKYNAAMTTGGSSTNTTGTAFVIGNGTGTSALSNAFSVQYSGIVKAKSTITASTTADYAEFFEWLDGNPNNEDRVGYFVTLDGDKIRIATAADDYILGVVSGEPFVLGNGDCDTWNGMYLHDEFRRTIYEPAPKMIEILDSEGNPTGEYKEAEGEFEGTRPKLNPEYDHTQPYTSRFERKEWAPVGMLGVLAVRHDGTAKVNGYVTVNADGIATACEKNAENAYRVIKSNTDSVVEIIFR